MAFQIDLKDPKNLAALQALYRALSPEIQKAVDAACDARMGANGASPMANGNGCGCALKNNGGALPVPYSPAMVPGSTGQPQQPQFPQNPYPPNPGCQIAPMTPVSQQQQGLWNCQTVGLDLAQCDIDRIMREGHLVTFQADLAGPLSAGDLIAVEIAPIRVSHMFCVDELEIFTTSDDDPPVVTPIQVGEVRIQAENIYQKGGGGYEHAWTYFTNDRPSYVNVTSGRCACVDLCTCVPAEAHLRMYFVLPDDVANGDTLTVKFWGRRRDWQTVCGSCPVCDICDHEPLTGEELAAVTDRLYVID